MRLQNLSSTSWRQFLHDRNSYHLLAIESAVKRNCDFQDGTKRYFRFIFPTQLGIKNTVGYFQITSGQEISIPAKIKHKLEEVAPHHRESYFDIHVLDNENDYLDVITESLSEKELNRIIKQLENDNSVESVSVKSTSYKRKNAVKEFTKRKAKGKCQLCHSDAPFKNKYNEPYLEVHHVVPLSEKGKDSIRNTVALCPNCHRKMHIVKSKDDFNKLKKIAESSTVR